MTRRTAYRRKAFCLLSLLIWLAGILGSLFLFGSATGCLFDAGSTAKLDPIQRTVQTVMTEVVSPAISKALAETKTQNFAHQGALQGLNPTYHVKGHGYWVVGVDIDAEVGVEGLAGQFTWNTQTEQADEPPPTAAAEPPKPIVP